MILTLINQQFSCYSPRVLNSSLATNGRMIDTPDSARRAADALLLAKTWRRSTPGLRKLLTQQHRSAKPGTQTLKITLSPRVRAMLGRGQTRQQPGNACDGRLLMRQPRRFRVPLTVCCTTECRRKKQRCDRQRPRCSSCVKTQAVCRFNEKRASPKAPSQSAPKALESSLGMQLGTHF